MSCHNIRPSAIYFNLFSSIQSLSRARPFETPMDCSTPGFLVLHHLPEFVQTHAY